MNLRVETFCKKIALCFWLAAFISGCGKLANVPQFNGGKVSAAITSLSTLNSWSSSYLIDAGTSNVNNDTSATCLAQFQNGTEGCQISPPVLYSDNRWFTGFSQDYINTGGQVKYSLFASLSNLTTGLFGKLGFGLGLIDTALGLNGVATESSSRYVRFAKFPNGDVISVYLIEQAGPVRTVFSNVYSASTKTWSAAFQLGHTGYDADRGADYFNTNILGNDLRSNYLCRPSVATSGTAAMVAWCEDVDNVIVDPKSVIKYAIYSSGAWNILAGTPKSLVTEGVTAYAFPGFSGHASSFMNAFPAPHAPPAVSPADFLAGDIFKLTLTNGITADISTVMAVDAFATPGQFNIVYDVTNVIQPCETLQNMFASLLEQPTRYQIGLALTGFNLAGRGVSIEINPNCSDSDSTSWYGISYYNKALKPIYRKITTGVTDVNRVSQIQKVDSLGVSLVDYDYDTVMSKFTHNIPTQTVSGTPNQIEWVNHSRSAWVDVGGDGNGNFILVRSGVAPVFKNTVITPSLLANDVDLVGLLKGRMLFGHQYSAATGWKMDTRVATEPLTALLSNPPSCNNGVDNFACSIKNPKVLMSASGNGLVFFYQQQPNSYQVCPSGVDCNKNPNRLWYATYSSSTGYSSVASILDQDVVCSSSSIANDSAVCDSSSYTHTCGYLNSEGYLGAAKDITVSRYKYYNSPTAANAFDINNEITPIPAAMNKFGKALVTYHKAISTGSSLLPSCSQSLTLNNYIGLYVDLFDPVNGFANAVQIDDGLGFTMHSSVAISDAGKMAVVWEELMDSGAVYVYLRTYDGSNWSSTTLINDGYTAPVIAMMPSVGINERGDVTVTFTYAPAAGIRRQYARQYRSP